MDRALIQGIKRLRVLTPYDYDNMDELVQDLTSALEESSSSAQRHRCQRHPRPPQRKWWSKKTLLPPSDGDVVRLQGTVSSSTTCQTTRSVSAVSGDDSESSLEGRAVPRMPSSQLKAASLDGATQCTAGGSQQLCGPPAARAAVGSLCGKRKRSMRERSLESVGHRRSSECCDDMELEEAKPHHGEASSSSLSSSESDAGILTNDEGREGDDEQSDFFHEGGPSCWWDELDGELDARFQAILAGSLKHMSPAARRAYHNNAKGGRAIRSGRRRLAKSVVSISLPTTSSHRSVELLSKSENWPGSALNERAPRSCLAEVKRRRRTPPAGPVVPGLVGSKAPPVGESSVGHQLLRRLGWEPGRGLGPAGAGVLLPVPAHVRPRGRPGLGFAPPPPPPPSPQPSPTVQQPHVEGASLSS
ncbi:G patch domain-containing protein 2-like isoform X2 [Dermacentor albipictus]|uniref:G patch domain-containing protein 2-like isoform X2 n=1 Tax=Dermacentor albipictus TaxID=60249 RepID=UPI0038FCD3CE